MSSVPSVRLTREQLSRLRVQRLLPNALKIPLFTALMVGFARLAWSETSTAWTWASYVALGYLWMSMVTFMHDATHNTLFRAPWANWLFGIVTMVPIFASFVAFKEDHLEHHRYNRTPRDPDAFTMGRRGPLDFLAFYAYAIAGAVLSFVHFNLLYPLRGFDAPSWAIHLGETALKIAVYWWVLSLAQAHGVLDQALALWLWPIFFFSLFNSMRFIAEHYATPWDRGNLLGTRTIISNRVNAFFWNNINWHIGHHLYPAVPWYNLVEVHRLLEPELAAAGAIIDRSYLEVYWRALCAGPESATRLDAALAARPAVPHSA